jgi:pilus assembly protein CpaB
VSVDEESSVGYMIKPGDNVDALLTYQQGEGKQVHNITATILQAAQVVAVGTEFSGSDTGKKYNTLTLAVTPEEAELIIFAGSHGRVSFALRPVGETTKEKIKVTAIDDLLKQIKTNEKGEEDSTRPPAAANEGIKAREE